MVRRLPDGELSRSEQTMPAGLAELCAQAEARATERGHVLAGWRAPDGEEAVARAADCGRCGRGIYVRAEGDLRGFSGRVLTEPCDA